MKAILLAQAWADLRVAMAKSHPHTDPTTTDAYWDLHDSMTEALIDMTGVKNWSAVRAVTPDAIDGAHEMTLRELLHTATAAAEKLRRKK